MDEAKKFTKEQEEARGKLFELMPELKESIKENKDSKAKFISDATPEEKAMLDRAEDLKGTKIGVKVPGEDKSANLVYKGHSMINKAPSLGADMNSEEKNVICKWVIDTIDAYAKSGSPVRSELKNYMEAHNKTTLVEGTGNVGGYGVFDKFDTTFWGLAAYVTPIFSLADTQTIEGKTMKVTSEDEANKITAAFANEASAFAESNPKLNQLSMTLEKLGFFTKATNELIDDFEWDVTDWILRQGAEAVGRKAEFEVFQGTNFTRSFQAATIANSISIASMSALTYRNLTQANGKLEPQLRAGASWYVDYEDAYHIDNIQDDQKRPLFLQNLQDSVPRKILGKEVKEMVGMRGTDATSTDILMLLVDMKDTFKILRRKNDLDLIVDPYSSAPSWVTRFVLGTRLDGALVKPAAVVKIVKS